MVLKGNKPRSIETTMQRLTALMGDKHQAPLGVLTPGLAEKTYGAYAARVAVDTHRNTLGQARTWGRWLVKQGWLRTNPFEAVDGFGQRNPGKDQLRIDQARKLWAYLRRDLADKSSLAVAVAMLLGLRCSEIVRIAARDVDAGGTVLWVPLSKSKAGVRRLDIPGVIKAPLVARAAASPVLWPHRREWVLDAVKRRASSAGLDGPITAHGLRGLHATLAVEYGHVSAALGHAGPDVTRRHYLEPGAVERTTARKVWEAIDAD